MPPINLGDLNIAIGDNVRENEVIVGAGLSRANMVILKPLLRQITTHRGNLCHQHALPQAY